MTTVFRKRDLRLVPFDVAFLVSGLLCLIPGVQIAVFASAVMMCCLVTSGEVKAKSAPSYIGCLLVTWGMLSYATIANYIAIKSWVLA